MKKLIVCLLSLLAFSIAKPVFQASRRRSASTGAAPAVSDFTTAKTTLADLSQYVELKKAELDAMPNDHAHSRMRAIGGQQISQALRQIDEAKKAYITAVQAKYSL